jgi:hypothetical protein
MGALATILLALPVLSADIAWPQREGAPRIHATDAPAPYNFAADMAARGEQVPIEFDLHLDKADLVEVIDRFAFLLGDGTDERRPVSYILHSGVKGEVTLHIARNLSRQQAWAAFEHLLNSQGSHCIVRDGVLHILPMANAPQHPNSQPISVKDPS